PLTLLSARDGKRDFSFRRARPCRPYQCRAGRPCAAIGPDAIARRRRRRACHRGIGRPGPAGEFVAGQALMRVLVTGATGFVGSATVPVLLQRGWNVRAAVRGNAPTRFSSEIEVVRHGDLAAGVDWAPLLATCDAVVHLAGIAHSDGVP